MNSQMIGSIPEFNSHFDDWSVYSERLEQFFEVNEVSDEKRSAFLISVIGTDAYKSLRDLCHPTLPKDKPFEVLCELLRKQFSPQVSIFRERAKFYNARQQTHENVTQWYGQLKRLSVDCKFGSNLDTILLDKFVTGLRPGQVLDRLCEENETLKLEQALDIAVNKECAAKDNAYAPGPVCSKPGFNLPHPRLAICPPAPAGYSFGAPGGFGGFAQGANPASSSLFGASAAPKFKFGAPPEPLALRTLAAVPEAERTVCDDGAAEAGDRAGCEDVEQAEGCEGAAAATAKAPRRRHRRRGGTRRNGAGGAAGEDADRASVASEEQ